ncbi:mucin TcMUCII [Trypanosoma cruzi]|nr:mucin TcMUCII [Trypanosoma cruzi]
MRFFLIGCVHSVSLYCGEAIAPCLAYNYLHRMEVRYRDSCKASLVFSAPTEDTSVYLEGNLPPLRKILWLRALTQQERCIRLHDYGDLRSPIYSEPMPPSMHGKAATSIPLQRDAVINELHRVCNIIGTPRNHLRAPLLFNIEFFMGHCELQQSEIISATLFQDTSDDVRRTAFDSIYSSLGDYDFELWMDSPPLPLNPHLDPLHYCTTPPRQMMPLWRSIVQQLAGSRAHIEQSALPSKMALGILYLLVWKYPNRPHEFWWQRTPCQQLRRSVAHWPCETALLKRF